MLRHAFTFIELVFVIVVIGILSAIMTPKLEHDHTQEAVDQLMQHIRYAQHLALMHDPYIANNTQELLYNTNLTQSQKKASQWFKGWWQIQIHNATNNYSIYSDHPTTGAANEYGSDPDYSANPKLSDQIAADPQTGLYLMREDAANGVPANTRFTDVDLNTKYGVTINMPSCRSVSGVFASQHILFDPMGRPHCAKTKGSASLNPMDRLVNARVEINLVGGGENRKICIEAETGYVHDCTI